MDAFFSSMNGRHLSQYSTWNPSKAGKRRIATLNLKQIHVSYPHWTHVIVRVTSTHKPVKSRFQSFFIF